VTDHGLVRGNGYDYANGIYNGYGHNNANFPGQRISNGNDNGKCNGDVTWLVENSFFLLKRYKLKKEEHSFKKTSPNPWVNESFV
jgi:hypothetical protein